MIDTRANNPPIADHQQVWLFGYGSLIYKVDFPYLQRRPARLPGWSRRFWQGSHDHRGTADAPGRVVTLVQTPGEDCLGMAYQVSGAVFAHLDHREKNGYLRLSLPLFFADQQHTDGLVYIAGADNGAYLGPAPEAQIAAQIARSQGPSGSNRDYLLQLAAALRELGAHDQHVFTIEQLLLQESP